MLGKVFVGETSSDLANTLVLFILRVIASKKEAAVKSRPLPLAEISSDNDQINCVTNSVQVVFLEFEPVVGSPCNLVCCINIQSLHHQSLAVVFDAVFECLLNLLSGLPVHGLGVLKLILHKDKVGPQNVSPLLERLGNQ